MGTGEDSTPANSKSSKPVPSTQEIPTTPAYPDWSNSMQAYYGAGATPPPFFASTVPSPTPHPYLWGGQHPLLPPYGTPVPYPAIYPTGGVYGHPNMTLTPNSAQPNTELEGKSADGKDWASTKKSKGNSASKAGETTKAASASGNDATSQSGDNGSDGSSDASDENTNQQEAGNKKGRFDQMLAYGANVHASVPGKPVGSMPATNLNIGMDFWNASPAAAAASGSAKIRPNASGASSAIVPAIMPEQWIQDERELKSQKRKQSNRESARRSRLRKQAECEELQARVENLSNDNSNLRDELLRISDECEKLKTENESMKEELVRLYGPDAIANLEQSNHSSAVQSRGDEGNS